MSNQMNKEELKQARKDAKALLKKPFYKKIWFWILVVIVVIIIANMGGSDDTTSTPNDSSNNAPTNNTAKEEVKLATIGEVVRVGDVEFTVNSISTAKNVGGEYGTNAQGTYLLVDTTVKNVGNEAITTDSSFFKLLSGEKTFEADSSAAIYANEDTSFFYESINPDLALTGIVVFDVTDEVINNPELVLQVQTGFFGTETGKIKIGK